MQKFVLGMLVLGLVAGAATAQYHDSKYLFGGYGTSTTSTTTTYSQGPYVADTSNLTFKQIGAPHFPQSNLKWYYGYRQMMDSDNQRVVNFVRGSTSTSYTLKGGLFRTDPANSTVSTIFTHPDLYYSTTYGAMINQDGDYVTCSYVRTTTPTTTYAYTLLKVNALGSSATTILSSATLGWQGSTTYYGVGTDIDTGNYHLRVYNSNSANAVRYGFLNVSLDGSTVSTWSTGSTYGLYTSSYDGAVRDWSTGDYVTKYSQTLYRLKAGNTTRTTLWNIGYPGGISNYYACKSDLRSAPTWRLLAGAYQNKMDAQNATYYAPAICMVDMATYTATYTVCDPMRATSPNRNYPYNIDFYQGRHIQTLKVAPKKWQLRFSCPQFPLKRYVAAVSLAGYKPPVTLGDGRRIWLLPDAFTQMSLLGLLTPFFSPGPQILNSNGEAQGSLDFTLLPSINVPMWIALVVIDPNAPAGIAYLPDTYVFRIP